MIELKKIVKAALEGDELPFNRFVQDLHSLLFQRLISLTKNRLDAEDVFMTTMQKIWERFVISQEKLPLNIEAYTYVMCKNAWLLQKRSAWQTKVVLESNALERENIAVSDVEGTEEPPENNTHHKVALTRALEGLTSKCKALMEVFLDPNQKLKDVQEELGYANYQALVQAKYNCQKRLVRKVYEILNELGQS